MIPALILAFLLASSPETDLLAGPQGRLLGWLMKTGRMQKSPDPGRLDALLRRGEAIYLDGGSRAAAAAFGSLLLDPSFWELSQTPIHDNIRYDLAGALIREEAVGRARQILLELISRRPSSAFRAPAFRKLTDLTLASGQYEQSLVALDALPRDLSEDERDEVAYLKGTALSGMGFPKQARQALSAVSAHSRFRAPALYLQGVLALEQGDPDQAGEDFCAIVRQPGGRKFTFFVSARTLEVIDQAWLALARIRHDQGQYLRALETYRQIPPGTAASTPARYESAWSLFRAERFDQARRQISRLIEENPGMADYPAALLLLGYSLAGDCHFDQAREVFAELHRSMSAPWPSAPGVDHPQPPLPVKVQSAVPPTRQERQALDTLRKNKNALERTFWMLRQLRRLASGMPQKDPKLPLEKTAGGFQAALSRARHLDQRLSDLRFHLGPNQRAAAEEANLLAAQVAVARARAGAALNRLHGSWAAPAPLDSPPAGEADLPRDYLAAEQEEAANRCAVLLLQRRSAERLSAMAQRSWALRAAAKVEGWTRMAAIGKIDTVIAQKQAREIEIQNLAQDRYPLELFRELSRAGLVDESMEYWPYDGEEWPDETR